ncbi:MAG: hypothetical protein PVF58_14040 [Candidatus Methanofastidiosia archaeon]|jgi:hypothetical protein
MEVIKLTLVDEIMQCLVDNLPEESDATWKGIEEDISKIIEKRERILRLFVL